MKHILKKLTLRKIIKAFIPYGFIVVRRKYLEKRTIEKQKKTIENRLKKRTELRLSIHLVDQCNLNCKGCDNFSCIADEKYHSPEALEKDFRRIYELANGKINLIQLMGGEPLLHPELLKILDIAGRYFSKTDLQLVTNGVLLLKQTPEFWLKCKANNIKVTITKYPINLPFAEIEKTAKKHGVVLGYYGDTGISLKQMHKMPMNLDGCEDPVKSFELCYKANTCIMLDDGKIYTCATIPYIKYFNKYFGTNLTVCEDDYIDIYKTDCIDKIFGFLCKPMPFCRYCNTKHPCYGIDWAVSKKEISEWI